MPPLRFRWDAFDSDAIRAFAQAWGHDPRQDPDARAWLQEALKRPTEDFVRKAKTVIEDVWLPTYPGTRAIVDRLIDAGIGPMNQPRSDKGYVDYIRRCRNSSSVRCLLVEAMRRFGDQDRTDDGVLNQGTLRRFAVLEPEKQERDTRRPHSYQLDAWNRLSAENAQAEATGKFEGILAMPTGSGKTFTTVHWLYEHVLNASGRVLWLAHRYELLEQAANEFYRLATLAREKQRLRIRIVSGQHCAMTQIDPADDVVIASVPCLARRPEIAEQLLTDTRTFLVVDEAHHAPAKSYKDAIDKLRRRPRYRLLGLTATPTRTMEDERPVLSRLFGGKVLYSVKLPTLIEQGFLARPRPVRVSTGAEVDAEVTREDEQHLARFDDLSEEWLDRIAHMTARNQTIIEHYREHQAKYGKTLIFAINVLHAALLAEQLRQAGIDAEYIASYRPDGTDKNNRAILERYRDRGSGLDVLVNVQILTEGVDLPITKTVFLTRPSRSETLVRQMIGRALRGPAAGGNPEAWLVSFEDHWGRFRDWQSPLDLVPDLAELDEVAEKEKPTGKPASNLSEELSEVLPWELIHKVAAKLRDLSIDQKADQFEAIPHGWYVLDRVDDGEAVHQVIAVYEHQRPSWDACCEHLARLDREALEKTELQDLIDEFFVDCDEPQPSSFEVHQLLEHFLAGGGRPEFKEMEERRQCDPYELADHIWTSDLGERAKAELLQQRYTSLAKAIYPSLREFRAAVEDALHEKLHPEETTRIMRAVPVFEPRSEEPLPPGAHDLSRLFDEMLLRGAELLGLPKLPHGGPVDWTKRLVKGWYGIAYFDATTSHGYGRIRINTLLNSSAIRSETVVALLWHEYLHLYLKQGHTKEFRACERKWPGFIEAERELDTLNERFGVQYW